MSKSSSAFGKIVVWLLVVVLIVAVVGVALYFGLRERGMTFYVEYNGQRYVGGTDGDGLLLRNGETHEFSVKSLMGGEVGYSVKITSNADSNVSFEYGGELHYLFEGNTETDDYSDIFGLQADTDGFSVAIPLDMTVEQAIETKLGGDITLIDELSESTAYFVVTVTVDESSVDLPFVLGTRVAGVTLDPPSIIF